MSERADRLKFEKSLWSQNYKRIMGLDEVGRGCLSGPVVAAGVILPPGTEMSEYMDSKKLIEKERIRLAQKVKEEALFWTVQSCTPAEIDKMNILNASITAMLRCAEAGGNPDYLLVDGNRYTVSLIPFECITGGDDLSASIGAASIIAKVYRDTIMKKLHLDFPQYGWNSNVGYPTKTHFEGLEKHGYTHHHRKSFKLRTRQEYRV